MYEELAAGYTDDPAEHLKKRFHVDSNDMVVEKDIPFYSFCEHHMLPFYGTAAIAFAGSLGIGVAFSGASVLLVEGLLALLASLVAPLLTDTVLAEITFTGSLLIIGIGLNILGLTKLRILNMMPAVLFPILLCRFL